MTSNTRTARAALAYTVIRADLPSWASDNICRTMADRVATEDPQLMPATLCVQGLKHETATRLARSVKEAWLGLEQTHRPVSGMNARQVKVYDVLCAELSNRFWSQDEIREAAEEIGDGETLDASETFSLMLSSHESWDDLREKVVATLIDDDTQAVFAE